LICFFLTSSIVFTCNFLKSNYHEIYIIAFRFSFGT
jgi:hypothetical protein